MSAREAGGVARSASRTRRVWVKRVGIALAAGVLAATAGFIAWGSTPLGPSDAALDALRSGGDVTVSEQTWGLSFSPTGEDVRAGLVIYPGGRVDHRSYAPLARDIAKRGFAVAIVRVPLSLAILEQGAADAPVDEAPSLPWAVGGHSLGGVAAAEFAARDERVHGLLLLASYPIADLSASGLAVIDVTGTRDTVLDRARWEEASGKLPADTERVSIDGGNHAQFGSYGAQPGDAPAGISEAEQRRAATDAAVTLLERLAQGTQP